MTDVNTIADSLPERLEQLEEENEEMNILIHAANEKLKEFNRVKEMNIIQFIKWKRQLKV